MAACLSCSIIYAQDEDSRTRTYEENLKRWQGLSEQERQAIRERAQSLGPAKISEMKEELARFNNMPKEGQDRIKDNYNRFTSFTPEERKAVEQKYERFEKMPQERKDEFRRQFKGRGAAPLRGPAKEIGTSGQGPGERHGENRDIAIGREGGQARREEQRSAIRGNGAGRGEGPGMGRGPGEGRGPGVRQRRDTGGGRGPGPGFGDGRGGNPPGPRGGGRPCRGGVPRGRGGPGK